MRRGGYRPRRYVRREDAAVWGPGGRWGPRRVRVTECYSSLRAEDLYTALLRDAAARVRPGAAGTATLTVQGRSHVANWEVRQNAVWKRGRVFLLCPRCLSRCTRLYLPLETSWLACRRCWGLTYQSRTHRNYKNCLWGGRMFAALFGTTQREMALDQAATVRQERRAQSLKRWSERRSYLGEPAGPAAHPRK